MNAAIKSPATSLRVLQLGDTWTYSVLGNLTPPGNQPLPLSGGITVSIVPDKLTDTPGGLAILFAQEFQISQPDGSKQAMPAPALMFSFVQDGKTRDVAIAADNMTPDGSARVAAAPQVFYPGKWSAQTGYNNRLEFHNGDVVHNTLTVVGKESVETGQGVFVAWKATITSESAATGLIEGLDWWTPELGAPAKFATRSTLPDGSAMQFTATLARAVL